MSKSNEKFWEIIETRFPEHSSDRFLDEHVQQQPPQSLELDQDKSQGERIIAASHDGAIADYFMDGIGEEESLIAQLQRKYHVSEEEAEEAINEALGRLTEVVDLQDEDYPSAGLG